ncbi:uncharacterized protein FOBCDRAFT_265865 [Fusarium oxysporum Fo47]|nr:uncharacterized protein FOBCDRAFT_265865 [Fusarium oxysporum Fo47]WJG37271.1 hypothetical protein FOBCDRAFT_265865 [Fusarium oxysporum Fo47]
MTQDTSDRIVPLLSYLDNLTPGLCERGIIDNASRKTERLEEAKGRYFCLPVVRDECFVKNGRFLFEDSFETLYCLALFQPTHQDTVFHRIGMIRFEKEIPSEQFEGFRVPYKHISGVPCKNIRNKFIKALNVWIEAPVEKMALLKEVTNILHNSSLMSLQ